MTPEQKQIRANEAKQLLDNQMLQEAFTALKGDIYLKFEKTSWLGGKERTELWRTLKNLNNLEAYLGKIVTTGKLSSNNRVNR